MIIYFFWFLVVVSLIVSAHTAIQLLCDIGSYTQMMPYDIGSSITALVILLPCIASRHIAQDGSLLKLKKATKIAFRICIALILLGIVAAWFNQNLNRNIQAQLSYHQHENK